MLVWKQQADRQLMARTSCHNPAQGWVGQRAIISDHIVLMPSWHRPPTPNLHGWIFIEPYLGSRETITNLFDLRVYLVPYTVHVSDAEAEQHPRYVHVPSSISYCDVEEASIVETARQRIEVLTSNGVSTSWILFPSYVNLMVPLQHSLVMYMKSMLQNHAWGLVEFRLEYHSQLMTRA